MEGGVSSSFLPLVSYSRLIDSVAPDVDSIIVPVS
jgi:hypothetical protein